MINAYGLMVNGYGLMVKGSIVKHVNNGLK